MLLLLSPSSPSASPLVVTKTSISFDSRLTLAAYTEIVTGGLAPYSASSSNTSVCTVTQATSPNLWSDSDTLTSSTLSGFTKASGGPGGAVDAEYTGTGSPIGSNAILDRVVPVVMGQTYTPSFFIDPSQITNNNGSTPNVLTEFAGSTANGDGSYSNITASSTTGYTFTSGQPFTVAVDIATGSPFNSVVQIGTNANRYYCVAQGDGNFVLYKVVNGTQTGMVSSHGNGVTFNCTGDLNFHTLTLTVIPGATNTIMASWDNHPITVAATDSSLNLLTGTWNIVLGTNGVSGKIRRYTINPQIAIGINTADNLTQILQQYVALNTTTAGRYATSAWTCPTNLAPHSDDFSGWSNSGGSFAGGGPGGATAFEVSDSGQYEYAWRVLNVTPGVTYTLSAWADPSQISAGSALIAIYDPTLNTAYAGVNIGAAVSRTTIGRYAANSWTCPADGSILQVALLFDSTGCNIASGQKLKFSQPMLERASSASGYYISSQNPQVQVFAQLLSSAIVTSGQKFKISQPMLTLSTYDPTIYLAQTAVWNITPRNGGAATITYTDSTP